MPKKTYYNPDTGGGYITPEPIEMHNIKELSEETDQILLSRGLNKNMSNEEIDQGITALKVGFFIGFSVGIAVTLIAVTFIYYTI